MIGLRFGLLLQVRSDGTLMDASERSSYYWLPKSVLGEVGNMSPSKLVPHISTPFSTAPLGQLVFLIQCAMKHNFLSSMLVLSGGPSIMRGSQKYLLGAQ